MKQKVIEVNIRRSKSRKQLQRERRWQIAENILTVLLGLSYAAALFWCGWLVGAGVVAL